MNLGRFTADASTIHRPLLVAEETPGTKLGTNVLGRGEPSNPLDLALWN